MNSSPNSKNFITRFRSSKRRGEAIQAESIRRAILATELHGAEAAKTFEGFVKVTTPTYRWGWFNRDLARTLQEFMEAVERGERLIGIGTPGSSMGSFSMDQK